MRKTIKIRNMELGAGRPKVCVPITAIEEEEILREARLAVEAKADLIEWRADFFAEADDMEKTVRLGSRLRDVMGSRPILFTYRTEGSGHSMELEKYIELNQRMADAGDVDLLDIELFMGDEVCQKFCEYAHERNKTVIISNHDFDKTPNDQEIVERMCKMRKLGADVPKVAVMPRNAEDVLTLLSATNQYANAHADGPLITMSMGWLGQLSRISGEIFGSALTFGSTTRTSAPGQLDIADLKYVLDVLHRPENV